MTISISLPDETVRQLNEAARRLNVSMQDLAAALVRDLVSQPASDFDAAASRVRFAARPPPHCLGEPRARTITA
jgi:hypothetical protein